MSKLHKILLKPTSLKKGDTIGFFSPSSAATFFAPKRFARAVKYLEEKGFTVVQGKLTGQNDYYRSGSIATRATELNELINNPAVRCIISVIGGLNSNSLLPYIDYEALEKDPKIIIGYSDVTALLLGIYSKINLVTFYGPALVASFGEVGDYLDTTYDYFSDIVVTPCEVPHQIANPSCWTDEYINWEEQDRPKNQNVNDVIVVTSGIARGRLVVGNLNTIAGIYGTEYMPAIQKGDILVIEDSLKSIGEIERSFSHLYLAGVFNTIGGLVLGKHEKFDDKGSGRKPFEVLMEVIGEVQFPIIADYDCCHTHPMITLPIGVMVELNTETKSLTLLEKWMQ